MSYLPKSGPWDYFVDDISVGATAPNTAIEMDIGASSADHGEVICVRSCQITRFKFILVGELAGGTSTAPTVIFKHRPTAGSATGEVLLATLTIPDATAVGQTLFVDVNGTQIDPGEAIEISHTVGTGTPTGMGFWSFDCEDSPQDHRELSVMVESA